MAESAGKDDTNFIFGGDLRYVEELAVLTSEEKLYQWQYEPAKTTPRALLFIAHGYGEHSKRYDEFARLLCSELECVVVSHDHVGHGKSEGERVMIDKFDMCINDVLEHIDQVKKSYPELPVFIFGHSMGGAISILAACKRPDYFTGVVLSAPAIVVDPSIAPGCFLVLVANLLIRIRPSMMVIPALDPKEITTDEAEAANYDNDPLNWHQGFKVKMARRLGDAMEEIHDKLIPTIKWPFLIVHGDNDKVTFIGGSEDLMKNAASTDKEMKVYKGLKHDLLHEVKDQRDQIKTHILKWLRKRIVT